MVVPGEAWLVRRDGWRRDWQPEAVGIEQVLLHQPPPDLLGQVGQRERRQRSPGHDRMSGWRALRAPTDDLVKEARAFVVEALHDLRSDRWQTQREAGKPVEHVGRGSAYHRPTGGDDPPGVEVVASVTPDQERKPGQSVGIPAEGGVELRRGVKPRLVGLHDPQEPVAVDRPLSLDPFLVAKERRHARRVAYRDQPRPGEERRLEGRGHEVGPRAQVVEQRAHEADRLSPEDRVADEAVRRRGRQQRLELGPRPSAVKPSPRDRAEAGVPVPLPWIPLATRRSVDITNALPLSLSPIAIKRVAAQLRQSFRRGSPAHFAAFLLLSDRRYPAADGTETDAISAADWPREPV